MKKIDYNYLQENQLILFEVIVGSQAYGTNIETSDVDKKFVYILPIDTLLGMEYCPQIEVNKDHVGYELKRFLELLNSNNPTLLEVLNSPTDCILTKHPLFDLILEQKEQFLTKGCKDSFGGYARQQIKKARGLDKKQNWEKERIERKHPIDFCYVIEGYGTVLLTEYLERQGKEQLYCGISNIPHARDLYALFYDQKAHDCFSLNVALSVRESNKKVLSSSGDSFGFGYKGIEKTGEGKSSAESNKLRLSSIPKGEEPLCLFAYNQDAYTKHCQELKQYQEWLKSRNEQRWVDVKGHGQKIDGKNLMHCKRLIQMAVEIAEGNGVNVRREDAQELLRIRSGEVSLDALIDWANAEVEKMDALFDGSDLPERVEPGLVNALLIEIRKKFYVLV